MLIQKHSINSQMCSWQRCIVPICIMTWKTGSFYAFSTKHSINCQMCSWQRCIVPIVLWLEKLFHSTHSAQKLCGWVVLSFCGHSDKHRWKLTTQKILDALKEQRYAINNIFCFKLYYSWKEMLALLQKAFDEACVSKSTTGTRCLKRYLDVFTNLISRRVIFTNNILFLHEW